MASSSVCDNACCVLLSSSSTLSLTGVAFKPFSRMSSVAFTTAKIKNKRNNVAFAFFVYICNTVAFIHLSDSAKYTPIADKLGITSAVICAVHCLVIPAIFLLKYSWADGVSATSGAVGWGSGLPHWWETLDYLFLVVGLVAVYHAATHTERKGVKASLWFFWLCLVVAVVFESQLHWMAYIASGGLVVTHFVNIRSHRAKKGDKKI